MKIKIKQHIEPMTAEQMEHFGHVLIILAETERTRWPDFPHAPLLQERAAQRPAQDATAVLATHLPNGTHVALGRLTAGADAFTCLTLARHTAQPLLADNPREIAVLLAGFTQSADAARAAEATVAALLAGAHPMPTFKSTKAEPRRLAGIQLFGVGEKLNLHRTQAEAEGNNLARYLTALPGNQLGPRQYLSWISVLAKQHGWKLTFLDQKALARKKAGAFLAVAQGSGSADAGIVHLHYSPSRTSRKAPLALVGKGICFDSGGLNLKSAKGMQYMHQDMAGSAVALGTLLALTLLKVDFPVDCWLALAQNTIGPQAYRQGDVLTAANGTTIEVVHTDAEGRLVLADTLALAAAAGPAFIIDYATLTHAAVVALGTGFSAAFTNQPALLPTITTAGQESGERVWPFPMAADYDAQLESEIADVQQCRLENEADHILGARFLNRFIPAGIPWLHLDLAAASHKNGLAHIPTELTGFGVRYTLCLLLDQNLLA